MTLRIVLVEDHTSLRQALAAVISMQEDLVAVSYTHLTLPTKRIV